MVTAVRIRTKVPYRLHQQSGSGLPSYSNGTLVAPYGDNYTGSKSVSILKLILSKSLRKQRLLLPFRCDSVEDPHSFPMKTRTWDKHYAPALTLPLVRLHHLNHVASLLHR
jgi:hypothetical protein